ncbi:MAG: hypothetical protein ACK4TG_12235, partial [Thermaurantiacus sp.]
MTDNILRTLAPDELITEPGFYAIPMERHHGQPCDGPSVTSSILRTLELGTPADVWAFHALNPNRYPRPETDALRMGRAMAAYVEGGPERLKEVVRVLPADKPNRPTPAQRKAYREGRATDAAMRSVEFWAKMDADPRAKITETEWESLTEAGAVLAADPGAAACLHGIPEVTMAWFCEESRLWVLSRPDVVSFDGTVADYKRMATQGGYFTGRLVDQRITGSAYDMQLALGVEAFELLTGERPTVVGLVCQLAQAPHHVILRGLDDDVLGIAQWRNRRARLRFRECLDSGHWPGPGEVVENYVQPDWLRERLQKEMETA